MRGVLGRPKGSTKENDCHPDRPHYRERCCKECWLEWQNQELELLLAKKPGTRRCMMCEQEFQSWDVRLNKRCDRCSQAMVERQYQKCERIVSRGYDDHGRTDGDYLYDGMSAMSLMQRARGGRRHAM